jgi:hypothetical protein
MSVLPGSVSELLRETSLILGSMIESVLEAPPELEVLWQSETSPPHPGWVVPPLGERSRILVRRTGYRIGDVILSRNLAYVDLNRVDPGIAQDLLARRLHLGELFLADTIEKSGFEFDIEERIPDAASLHDLDEPHVSRRYTAAMNDRIAFVVIESLPIQTWNELLDSLAARLRLRELVHP